MADRSVSTPEHRRSRPHNLRASYDGGFWSVEVDCPDEAMGDDRPCAVWANDDGTKRRNECTFQQYAVDCDPEEWLHGQIQFPPVKVVEGGSGEDWHAILQPDRGPCLCDDDLLGQSPPHPACPYHGKEPVGA